MFGKERIANWRRRRQAADWFALLRSGRADPAASQQFRRWLEKDPENAREYAAIEDTWQAVGALDERAEIAALRRDARQAGQGFRPHAAAGKGRPPAPTWAAIGAAAMLVLVVAAVWSSMVGADRVYQTARGEQMTQHLPDGTSIVLNTGTRVVTRFTSDNRRVVLERGQAYFDVAADQDRPFLVLAGGNIVKAVGTEFEVYRRDDAVAVTLVEGAVEVFPDMLRETGEEAPPWKERLSPGERLIAEVTAVGVPNRPKLERVRVDVEQTTAWRRGLLDFDKTRLADAVAEVNRYSDRRIHVAEAIADRRISGVFEIGDTDTFLSAVEAALDVAVVKRGNDAVRISID